MDGLRQYILTMVLAAILCAVVVTVLPEKAGKQRMIRMICGFFLLAAACKPIGGFAFAVDTGTLDEHRRAAERVQTEAQAQADEAMLTVITNQTETYIEDKAKALGAAVSAAVTLDKDMLPWQVELTGEVSPYVKTRLSQILSSDLGIPDERQVWTP